MYNDKDQFKYASMLEGSLCYRFMHVQGLHAVWRRSILQRAAIAGAQVPEEYVHVIS
jgi:hypothetical protein